MERTYRQAAKHLHAAQAADIAVLMGAWGELGYTPRDRLFMNQVCACVVLRVVPGTLST